jgi:hypothetical protein
LINAAIDGVVSFGLRLLCHLEGRVRTSAGGVKFRQERGADRPVRQQHRQHGEHGVAGMVRI